MSPRTNLHKLSCSRRRGSFYPDRLTRPEWSCGRAGESRQAIERSVPEVDHRSFEDRRAVFYTPSLPVTSCGGLGRLGLCVWCGIDFIRRPFQTLPLRLAFVRRTTGGVGSCAGDNNMPTPNEMTVDYEQEGSNDSERDGSSDDGREDMRLCRLEQECPADSEGD